MHPKCWEEKFQKKFCRGGTGNFDFGGGCCIGRGIFDRGGRREVTNIGENIKDSMITFMHSGLIK